MKILVAILMALALSSCKVTLPFGKKISVPENKIEKKPESPRWKRGDCVGTVTENTEAWEKPTEDYKYMIVEIGKAKYLMFMQFGNIVTSLDMEFFLMDSPHVTTIECPKKFKGLSDYLHANPDAVINYEGNKK